MALGPGSRVGSYEIIDWIGAGGMGEVYRARDPRLQRDVAIKVLSGAFASDPGRLARFEREAQTLASMNHPNIAQIHGVTEGPAALVMEFVEGEDLAQRLSRERIPLREALQIARQIAGALEAAHARGVIHRDLKPANVRLTRTGQVKVLDFGLAKSDSAPSADGSDATLTSSLTIPGTILGTAAYMSPEQARGRDVDARTDIWALGCVLFEMITGRRAFGGATISDTLAAVLERDPDWSLLPAATSLRVTRLIRRCLEKDPERRLHAAADARIEIDDILSGVDEKEPVSGGRSRERWLWIASLALLATVGALLLNQRPRTEGGAAVYTTSIVLPDGFHLGEVNAAGRFAVSPDGKLLVVVGADGSGKSMLWMRALDSTNVQPLRGTEGASFPFWSPDSRSIAFVAQNKLKRIAAGGGDVLTLCDARFTNGGATWGRDDIILFTPHGGAPLSRVSAAGGDSPVQVTTLDAASGEVQHSHPHFLPDGRHFLYMAIGSKAGGITDPRGIFVGSLDSKEPGRPLTAGSNPRFGNGHLVFVRGNTLLAQPFDPDRLTLSGQPVPLVEQLQVSFGGTTGAAGSFSVSGSGVLVYQPALVSRSRLTWFDRAGTVLGTLAEPDDYDDVALSPDGGRVAISVLDRSQATRDLWAIDVARGVRDRLTSDPGDDFAPNWTKTSPTHIVFSSRRASGVNLYEKTAGAGETVLFADTTGKFNPDTSPDGRALVYVAGGGIISRSEIWMLPLAGERKPVPLVTTPFVQTHPRISPDGHWLSYTSTDSGQREVYVTSFPVPGPRTLVSAAGGGWARWNPKGGEIFYLAPNNDLIAVPITMQGAGIQVGAPARLFSANVRPPTRLDAFPFDVAPDGRRFLVNTVGDLTGPDILTLVINWPARYSR
jgi:Tol biopolymer transport system component